MLTVIKLFNEIELNKIISVCVKCNLYDFQGFGLIGQAFFDPI